MSRRSTSICRRPLSRAACAACDAADAALIVDDVRAGFRLDLGGQLGERSACGPIFRLEQVGRQRLLARGIDGNDRFREAATTIFTTGSFWCAALSMAAGVATLRVLQRDDGSAI